MRNTHGSFIWYELLTSDPDAAARFYGDVIGWRAENANQPGMDYRFFYAGHEGIAGHMKLPLEAADAGARPVWLGYIGVEDVDETVAGIEAAGGRVQMPAMDIEGVGRMAMVADAQGIPFYVMRGFSDQPSTSFGNEPGHCAWNELSTSDQDGALTFYTSLFGWEKGDAMPMGEMGDYQFINLGGEMIGAIMRAPAEGPPPMWRYYFQVEDIDASTASVTAGGGTVHHGPHEIPGGNFMIIASDPQGAMFGAVGPRK
ncbi:MAG TPA: VOC family protein [Allosphingosinicella sp.]|uniref:VOC family protein n=1 Tax=Allosphingosinicella sp. TaxID=2823234 RepID=UPI002EDAE70E